ncbi:HpcH/HpaI aldolase family protein [Vannielia litorea]|uniref:2-keto-3-deoxy-L-rhamnonate aldolase RhmA n=1 Tax=Vannielia litorea TaxID=1217970 RepID=A0A1N6GV69_9RHOB|nr:aldolase/citrate lyase family protein [Vannielia litorea]SIO11406.1 2-keto-3-deoxy-L-rhamnonate aldolase RhmA [Vannielia litorea]
MLKKKLEAGERLVGTVLKTPHYGIVEVLGGTGLDFVMLDAEHAPFSVDQIDTCALAARSVGLPLLVRLVEGTPAAILRVLDMGVAGIVVPNVESAAEAEAIVRATRYGPGGRGFAGTTRAGGFGTVPAGELIERTGDIVVVVQIESPTGVENAGEIAAVPGVDACFVGRADLAVSRELPMNAPEIEAATEAVFEMCKAAGKAPMMFVGDLSECSAWFARGARIITAGSEHKAIQTYFASALTAPAKRRV